LLLPFHKELSVGWTAWLPMVSFRAPMPIRIIREMSTVGLMLMSRIYVNNHCLVIIWLWCELHGGFFMPVISGMC